MSNVANKTSLDGSAKQAFEDLAYGTNGDKDNETNTPAGTNSTLTNDQITKIDDAIT